MAELSVQIGADVSDFLKKLNLTEKQFESIQKKARKAGVEIDDSLSGANNTIDGFAKTTKVNAVPAVTEFSRVIQDAPYGIQGVANNITQLTSSFGYLSKSTGGTKGALKAMLGTLAGPAGVLLVVSAVTSLMVAYGDEILNLISGNDALASSQKEVNKALSEFYGDTVTNAQAYVGILEDVNSTENERINAQEELMKLIPTITENDFNQADALEVVKGKLYEYVAAQAARVEIDKIVEGNSEDLSKQARIRTINAIKDEKKKAEAIKKYLKDVEGYKALDFSKQELIVNNLGGRKRTKFVDKTVEDLKRDFKEVENELSKDLKGVNSRLESLYSASLDFTPKKTPKTTPEKTTPKKTTPKKTTPKKTLELLDKDTLFRVLEEDIKEIEQQALSDSFISLDIPIDANAISDFDKFNEELTSVLENSKIEIEQWGQDIADAQKRAVESIAPINAAITDTFRAIFAELTSMFSTGNAIVDAFIGSIVNSLSTLLTTLITSLITEKAIAAAKVGVNKSVSNANAITTATSAAAAMGPAGAVALPALITSQLAIVNGAFAAAGGLASFAKGGFSGDNNLAWLNRDELVLRPTEMATLYNAIRGNNLSSLAGGGNGKSQEVFISKTVLRGSDQVIQYNRANKRMSRNY